MSNVGRVRRVFEPVRSTPSLQRWMIVVVSTLLAMSLIALALVLALSPARHELTVCRCSQLASLAFATRLQAGRSRYLAQQTCMHGRRYMQKMWQSNPGRRLVCH